MADLPQATLQQSQDRAQAGSPKPVLGPFAGLGLDRLGTKQAQSGQPRPGDLPPGGEVWTMSVGLRGPVLSS